MKSHTYIAYLGDMGKTGGLNIIGEPDSDGLAGISHYFGFSHVKLDAVT